MLHPDFLFLQRRSRGLKPNMASLFFWIEPSRNQKKINFLTPVLWFLFGDSWFSSISRRAEDLQAKRIHSPGIYSWNSCHAGSIVPSVAHVFSQAWPRFRSYSGCDARFRRGRVRIASGTWPRAPNRGGKPGAPCSASGVNTHTKTRKSVPWMFLTGEVWKCYEPKQGRIPGAGCRRADRCCSSQVCKAGRGGAGRGYLLYKGADSVVSDVH